MTDKGDMEKHMTLEDFEQALIKENIPREWVSLNEERTAPVTLKGKSLYYGKYGCTNFMKDIQYEYIFERLRKYKEESEFVASDENAQITDIEIISSESVKEYGEVFLAERTSDKGAYDTELLRQGFVYKGYDQYMGVSYYQKSCGSEIFTGVDIGLKIKTQDFEREQFGFTDTVMYSGVCFPFSNELREKIINYIREKKMQTISREDSLYNEVIRHYGFENIVKEEYKNLKLFDEAYKNSLEAEIERQILLNQYSKEDLLKVYRQVHRSNVGKQISKFSGTLSSRLYHIRKSRLDEAERNLETLSMDSCKLI